MANVGRVYECNGYSPDEIAEFYSDLTLADTLTAIAYISVYPDEVRD